LIALSGVGYELHLHNDQQTVEYNSEGAAGRRFVVGGSNGADVLAFCEVALELFVEADGFIGAGGVPNQCLLSCGDCEDDVVVSCADFAHG
jgi:hypothetical protein